MPRVETGPRKVEFNSLKKLASRMRAVNLDSNRISVDDADVPPWQRNTVWTGEEMGLLALSVLLNYPIGLVILWRKPNGIRVPIDGRQRLTAIQQFFAGQVAIPDYPGVPEGLKNKKYLLLPDDNTDRYSQLSLEDREEFDDYEPQIVEFEHIDESTAMDIFIRLQGGKSLTKTEVRAALGGRVCDFVTELTSPPAASSDDDESEVEPSSHHPFFKQVNVRNVRKAHRNLCDVLLHEHLSPGTNKHWSSLEAMYREKAQSLSDSERSTFKTRLGQFMRACSFREDGQTHLLPQLRSAYLILTFYRAWREVEDVYARGSDFNFATFLAHFETSRTTHAKEMPWVLFTSALSNAGYAENRIRERHDIVMSQLLRDFPSMPLKDCTRRTFTESQKLAIWDRAGRRCEFDSESEHRCTATFANFRDADADHIMRWAEGGPTTLENGRLLCQLHNRGGVDRAAANRS